MLFIISPLADVLIGTDGYIKLTKPVPSEFPRDYEGGDEDLQTRSWRMARVFRLATGEERSSSTESAGLFD
jgi:hypothetical protein